VKKIHTAAKRAQVLKRLKMRRENSYKAICKEEGISISTLSKWDRQAKGRK
jgi:uncharacterized protein YerC